MKRGTLGDLLPTSAKGHCGFVSAWSARDNICRAPATDHYLVDHPEGRCGLFVCAEHADRAAKLFKPLDRHPVSPECVHPTSVWQVSAPNRPGFCFVPEEDAEMIASLERELADAR